MNIKKCLSCGNTNIFHVIEKVYYKYFYNEEIKNFGELEIINLS